eukprot:GHVN01105157.1.p1 GENE.GHVN01105157.1~~GHVN01105157.1.p1  ORF type:complete len:612 (+),score=133.27 GHVN01105157.1:88-1923(+)
MTDVEVKTVVLDGYSLTPKDLYEISKGNVNLELAKEAEVRVENGRSVVDKIVESKEVVYGINTGFGLFSNVTVSNDKLAALQTNLIRSHCAGCGPPLSADRTRMLLALRLNVLLKGHSGMRMVNVSKMVKAFNANCLPVIPSKGTLGASGDLAPLSHLALGLMGEGQMWDPKTGEVGEASEILKRCKIEPIELGAKEGLAMINGTQMIASLGSEAIERSANVAKCADVACAFTLEVLCGTVTAYHPLIHKVRPHVGQQVAAARIRSLLQPDNPSELFKSHMYKGKVQDAYSLRCAPQVHGIAIDTIDFVRKLMTTELNSATDNPMVFTAQQVKNEVPFGFDIAIKQPVEDDPLTKTLTEHFQDETSPKKDISELNDLAEANKEIERLKKELKANEAKRDYGFFKKQQDTLVGSEFGAIMSGGNFHGEYPAKALDYLAIGVHELSAISERRIERLCNPSLSDLPAFLVKDGGFNSGFMIAHCTAAALVSENKVLTHPSSVDSLSTSAAKEDHVSMGGFAARKALEVVDHVETVIAIELLAACQALEFHRPHKTTEALEAVYKLIRSGVSPWDADRNMHPDIEFARQKVLSGEVWRAVQPFVGKIDVEAQLGG